MNNSKIIELVENRRAIKSFDRNHIISDDDFNMLLEVARQTPSAFGLEPWSIIVVQSEKMRDELKPYISGGKQQIETCSHFVVFVVTTSLLPESDYIEYINKMIKGFDDESHKAFISRFQLFQDEKIGIKDERNRIDWAGKQAYIALGSIMLAAAIRGIDSCAIEGFVPSEINSILRKHNIMEKGEHVAVMVAFGYRSENPTRKKARRELKEVVRYV